MLRSHRALKLMIRPVASAKRKLFLLDGNSLVYRAFFALPETITTSTGIPTNAIFGFASMLVKILSEHGPRATVVAWDAGLSGREVTYAEYKSQRPSRPNLLNEQWPHFAPMVEAFGYHNASCQGFEADDVIASLAEDAKKNGIAVTIVTGDRDAYQLVDDGNGTAPVEVMSTGRGVTDTKTYNRQAVIDRYGIAPELVPDFIGLKGDSSDNIPGVPGIGDKTASALLQEFGSLEGVLASIDQISGAKRKENLRENAELARISRDIAVLHRDLDCGVDLEEVMGGAPDYAKLRHFMRELELREPLRRLQEVVGSLDTGAEDDLPAALIPTPDLVTSEDQGGDLLSGLKLVPGTDIGQLATGGDRALALEQGDKGVSWASFEGSAEVLTGQAESLTEIVDAWAATPMIIHDYKAQLQTVRSEIAECPLPANLAFDTMLAAYLIDPLRRRYELEELAEDYDFPLVEASSDQLELISEAAPDLGARRAVASWRLAEKQRVELAELGLERLFYEIELPLTSVLCQVERTGVKLDKQRLAAISVKVSEQLQAVEQKVWDLAGEQFTIGSPQQLSKILFEKLELSRKRKGKTGFSTDAKVLRQIRDEHPIIEQVERWRELAKLKSTYLDALPNWISSETGRLHTRFNQAGSATGRLSSNDPNLQNIPIRTELGREIRGCFVAEAGNRLLAADYSQVELRILAAVADEPALKEIFVANEDVHTMTAAEVFGLSPDQIGPGERSRAKAVNFGIVYGLTPHGLSEQLDIPFDEARTYIDTYMARFPKVQQFIEQTVASAREKGYVETLFGRRRAIPELAASQPHRRQLGERLAVNTVIQGTAADVIKVAMINCHNQLAAQGLETKLVLQIHDELLFEAPESEVKQASTVICQQMQSACDLDPPLTAEVGVGQSWLEAKA